MGHGLVLFGGLPIALTLTHTHTHTHSHTCLFVQKWIHNWTFTLLGTRTPFLDLWRSAVKEGERNKKKIGSEICFEKWKIALFVKQWPDGLGV